MNSEGKKLCWTQIWQKFMGMRPQILKGRLRITLPNETANSRIEINKINSDMIFLEKQISDVAEGLKDVVTKSELADMMNSFVSDDDEKWLIRRKKLANGIDKILLLI